MASNEVENLLRRDRQVVDGGKQLSRSTCKISLFDECETVR
jgi:hypothetical protein